MPPRDFPSTRSEIRDPQDNQQWHSTLLESLRPRSFHAKSPVPLRNHLPLPSSKQLESDFYSYVLTHWGQGDAVVREKQELWKQKRKMETSTHDCLPSIWSDIQQKVAIHNCPLNIFLDLIRKRGDYVMSSGASSMMLLVEKLQLKGLLADRIGPDPDPDQNPRIFRGLKQKLYPVVRNCHIHAYPTPTRLPDLHPLHLRSHNLPLPFRYSPSVLATHLLLTPHHPPTTPLPLHNTSTLPLSSYASPIRSDTHLRT
ncbi:uncharacterized protein EI90DRAFT_3126119 [Cantharellus anzutake]|uniref:uncharacterized protein n=1 Tax=Cantharellus anzutake TaxID=1750568 RepID=UPI001903028E|nr:uncharacterized protein EI90DRAFT_3126119 [Cantharellus anzutake]KAF8328342.1 hypothetical protein EI90DRAFT_3126119 [Cantharellus anzutake]